jgi:hypothetical protein
MSELRSFNEYKGCIVEVLLKDENKPRIGWIGAISRMYAAGATFPADYYPTAWFHPIADLETYKFGETEELEEITIHMEEVESIKFIQYH